MELKQLEYIIQIAEDNNITRAAEKLFITQSALNQQLLKLENELGTQLFVRSRNNWHLTQAGTIYVENAKSILLIKKETYNKINDLLEIKEGTLKIGLTPERGTDMFAAIYPGFYNKYPKVKIEPLEMTVKEQQHAISQGNLDIGFVTLQQTQKTKDAYMPICSEELILCIPSSHPLAHLGGRLGEPLPEISLNHFVEDSFAVMRKGSTLREIYDDLLAEDDISPPILLETRSCQTLFELVAEGICCSVLPISYASSLSNVSYFSLLQHPVWEIAASYKKDSYLNQAAKELIALCKEYWERKMSSIR
ncbi:LysR family transcriptional regulator [Paenibacillus sp. 5J-6]|uniref:LysR family transcriptional regulator n=1 Tax=Paenibacillus silvestris TaxID=2606219 RepID=A0A6L8UUC9_9BACL|nr:LysR family transcriptional regulator [Paenibacillus silvestris]MZQ80942.1 LysR family transcriptional regulator [Paenibacillus silvestris]